MKAVRLLEYGGQLVFNDVPTPTIARDEILVKIKSTAVNHLDLVEASGTARQILPIDLPWIPGHEFSGVVEQIGSDVAACAPGDAVFGTTTGMGAYAEYLAVKAAAIARKPSNLSFEEAASVPHWLPDITLHNLRVGTSTVTLRFWTENSETRYDVVSCKGELRVERGRAPELVPRQ
jgi:NADPH:quinone reductase-like Zn-dependent oxidoreductase